VVHEEQSQRALQSVVLELALLSAAEGDEESKWQVLTASMMSCSSVASNVLTVDAELVG